MSFRLLGAGYAHANRLVALRGIPIGAGQGERIAVIGPSGAGKTTLLRVLGLSLRPTSGNIEALGVAPWVLPASALRSLRARIGLVHQAPPLPPRQRVITAVLAGRLGQWPLWKSLASLIYPLDVAGAHAALLRLDLADRLFDRCDRLSGGQLQRVGIARVLYQKPDLVLADEPVSSLDPALALQTVKLLCADAQARNATLVASLHAVDLALSCFPRIVGLREGNVAFDLPTRQVTDALLHELYAIEGETLPTQGNDPRVLGDMTTGEKAVAKVRLAG
ncbi:MAG: ATP-binding cassette domain-containing protein [Betaproteobacteria bacterium]|nr:ATP-binding cassette domain-containing protein [Betaproteobacteria bacterium]